MNIKSKSTLEKFAKSLRFKNYANNTIKTYVHYAYVFLSSFNKDVYHISQTEAINWLKDYNYTSISMQNQIISSIKLLYKHVVGVKMNRFNLERPRKQKKLPRVINHNHLVKSINGIENIKHKAILTLAYSTGMRVSEILNLKIRDIDSDQMLISILNSKFNKDRYVKLTNNTLNILRLYYIEHKPYVYLFNGQKSLKYSATSCNKIVKKYLGIDYHIHLIRHSYATKSMENGTNLRLLQNQMGHSSSKTLENYSHVSTEYIQETKPPI